MPLGTCNLEPPPSVEAPPDIGFTSTHALTGLPARLGTHRIHQIGQEYRKYGIHCEAIVPQVEPHGNDSYFPRIPQCNKGTFGTGNQGYRLGVGKETHRLSHPHLAGLQGAQKGISGMPAGDAVFLHPSIRTNPALGRNLANHQHRTFFQHWGTHAIEHEKIIIRICASNLFGHHPIVEGHLGVWNRPQCCQQCRIRFTNQQNTCRRYLAYYGISTIVGEQAIRGFQKSPRHALYFVRNGDHQRNRITGRDLNVVVHDFHAGDFDPDGHTAAFRCEIAQPNQQLATFQGSNIFAVGELNDAHILHVTANREKLHILVEQDHGLVNAVVGPIADKHDLALSRVLDQPQGKSQARIEVGSSIRRGDC